MKMRSMNSILYNRCFVESEEYPYQLVQEYIDEQLFEKGLCVKEKDHIIFKFTGVVFSKNQLLVVFPKGYKIPKEHHLLKKHVLILVDVLTRYSRENNLDPSEEEFLNGFEGIHESLESAFWLIEDYIENGIIHIHENKYVLNQGTNINWSRTIKRLAPIISNQRPLYLDVITKKRDNDLNNIITQIHRYAVNYCLHTYGWLFGYDEEGLYENVELPCDRDLALHLLDLEVQKTFVDREINLYNHLKKFIVGSNEFSKNKIFTYATPYFHWVWEKICSFLFSSEEVITLPRPYWEVNNRKSYTEQIPDILFRFNDTIYVVDAKYYRTKYAPQKLPGWGDLVKQFFYVYTLKEKLDNVNTENIFIFPGTVAENDIEYLGYAAIEGQSNLGTINGFVLDVSKAMQHYANHEKGNFKEKLVDLNSRI